MIYRLGAAAPQLPAAGRYWVAPNATIIGDVVLEDEVSVWFNAVVRADCERITIGAGSNVQDAAVLHADPGSPLRIGRDVTIGHLAMLHGCTIGDGSLVGIGAVVLNGAVIGPGSIVGAKALISEGKQFAPNSLIVGAPARAIRQLSPEQCEMVRRGVEHYRNNWRRFAADLAPIHDLEQVEAE